MPKRGRVVTLQPNPKEILTATSGYGALVRQAGSIYEIGTRQSGCNDGRSDAMSDGTTQSIIASSMDPSP
jgi:hypothetical protein